MILTESSNRIIESYKGLVPASVISSVQKITDPDWQLYWLQWAAIKEWLKRGDPPDRKIRKILRSIVNKSNGFIPNAKTVEIMAERSENAITPDTIAHVASFINRGEPTYIKKVNLIEKWEEAPDILVQRIDYIVANSSIGGIPENIVKKNGDQILIDFGDGFAWWFLDRASCDWEAKAGGHCGNEPRGTTDDRILSLRERKSSPSGKVYYKPHLTFVLSYGGYITEAKARLNRKPGPKYHPYIIELLKNPIIKGVAEGFFQEENDFDPEDLTDEEREEIRKANPRIEMIKEVGQQIVRDHIIEEISEFFKKNPGISDVEYERIDTNFYDDQEHGYFILELDPEYMKREFSEEIESRKHSIKYQIEEWFDDIDNFSRELAIAIDEMRTDGDCPELYPFLMKLGIENDNTRSIEETLRMTENARIIADDMRNHIMQSLKDSAIDQFVSNTDKKFDGISVSIDYSDIEIDFIYGNASERFRNIRDIINSATTIYIPDGTDENEYETDIDLGIMRLAAEAAENHTGKEIIKSELCRTLKRINDE